MSCDDIFRRSTLIVFIIYNILLFYRYNRISIVICSPIRNNNISITWRVGNCVSVEHERYYTFILNIKPRTFTLCT